MTEKAYDVRIRPATAQDAEAVTGVFLASRAARAFYERHGFTAVAFDDGSRNEEGEPAPAAGQMTGGRPSLVIRHTVDQRIGCRSPHGVRTPSAKPPAQARRPLASRVRARVSRVQVPR